jgi:nitrate/nitrite-specific signal transduction histidine kinase
MKTVTIDNQEIAVLLAPLVKYGGQTIGVIEIIRSRAESLAALRQSEIITVLVALGLAVGAFSLMWLASNFIVLRPLQTLRATTGKWSSGDLTARVSLPTGDEYEQLGEAFNNLTAQLEGMVQGLELKVAERTSDLQRRSQYLEAAARVAHAATATLDIEQLTREIVSVVREQFDLYYVGLFLTDTANEWAVLTAGTGEAGQVMLERGHRIKIGEGMVGWSIANARPRVAQEAGQDAVRLATAELPLTRSEAAIPLRSRGKVPGALTVQSDRANAFDETMLAALQTMADEVGVALDNARLYTEGQQTLETTRRLTGELTRKAWAEALHAQPFEGFTIAAEQIVAPTSGAWKPEMETAFESGEIDRSSSQTIALPIKVRDLTIGAVRLRKRESDAEWSQEDVRLVRTLTEQLGVALDSARLYSETQRRAQREHILTDITSRVRASTNINTILQTAIQELAEALQVGKAAIHLKGSDGEQAHE